MHTLTFYPIGNADCCLARLADGQLLLFDYADMRDPDDDDDPRIDLPATLRDELGERDSFDVVAFTHADDDHVCGMSEFFYLKHARKYQSDERVKIDDLWVPAAVIVENTLDGDAYVLQAEARHRLREGTGIRVFSRPDRLRDWFDKEGIALEDRAHLITDAGQYVPGWSAVRDGIEFFVHSPFAQRLDDGTLVDRNDCSLVLQATFAVGDAETRLLLTADTTWENLVPIIEITEWHKRDDRLAWDIMKIPHHCSYKSLSSEKSKNQTIPHPKIARLCEELGADRGILVSTSKPIPGDDTDAQPPHRQAANYYRDVAIDKLGQFKVTMEHPTPARPEPLVITIDDNGPTLKKRMTSAVESVTNQPAPRAG